jgi:enoyl-CoA hydratase/carnithine racemase
MTSGDLVRYSRQGRVARIEFNRPDKLNAFNDDMVIRLKQVLREFDTDEDAWVAIMSGEGRAFSAGADVVQRQTRSPEEMRKIGGHEAPGASVSGILFESTHFKPIITAPHGYAIGLALGFVLESDLIVAAAGTKFQIAEVPRGLSGARYWATLKYRSSAAFANHAAMTGRFFTAEEALNAGIVNRVVAADSLMDAAQEMADEILKVPPLAVRESVRAWRWYLQQFQKDSQLMMEIGKKLSYTEDFRSSVRAFVEKRPPEPFKGK